MIRRGYLVVRALIWYVTMTVVFAIIYDALMLLAFSNSGIREELQLELEN